MNLGESETIITTGRIAASWYIGLAVVATLMFWWSGNLISGGGPVGVAFGGFLLLLTVIATILQALRAGRTRLIVTNFRLLLSRPGFKETERDMPLSSIELIKVSRWTETISVRGTGGSQITVGPIHKVETLKEALVKAKSGMK